MDRIFGQQAEIQSDQDCRRKQEEKDRKLASMLHDVFDCDIQRPRPRKTPIAP